MILYHGSSVAVTAPDLQHTREDIDFGGGFYLTADIDMAKKWACAKRNSVVSVFDVDLERLNIYEFGLNEEWLDYIKANRAEGGNPHYDNYDMLIGPTADDKLFITLQEYIDGDITKRQAIEYLNIAGFSNQYVIKNEDALNNACCYIKSFEIVGTEKNEVRRTVQVERESALQKLREVKQLHKQIKEAQERKEYSEAVSLNMAGAGNNEKFCANPRSRCR